MNQVSFNKVRLSLAVLLCLCATSMVNAKVKLPALISDGMVLQREQPIKVWGMADAGESVGKVPEECHPYRCKRWKTKSYLHSHSR